MPKHASSDNGVIDKRPAAVTRRVDVADVITAVNVAHENRLLLAMRGGGHNGPGTLVPLVSFSSTRAAHERGRAVNRGIGQGSSSCLAIRKEGMLGSIRMAGGDDAKWHRFGAFVLEPGNEVLRKGERITNSHECDACGAAELRRHLPHNLMRLDLSTDNGICRLPADLPSSVGEDRQLVPRLVAGLYSDLKKV
jgi:hypothetical protein